MELVTKSKGFENSGIVYSSRVLKADGTPVVQSDLTSITCKVYATATTGDPVLVTSPAVVITSTVYNTLQTDTTGNIWTDDTGYNFKLPLDESCFPDAPVVYRIEFKLLPTSGSYFYLAHEHTTIAIFSE
jgi:hypothetical protein